MGKKAGKRLNKKQMSAMLEDFFRANPGKEYLIQGDIPQTAF